MLRYFTRLKASLMPYLFETAREAHENGVPMLRAMVMEFPNDPACATLDRQYMLGPSLLVAPVFSEEGVVEYYVPEGMWTSLIDGREIEGPCWKRETHGYMSLPLLVRENTVLPLGAETDRPDYDFAENVTLRIYALDDGRSVTTRIPNLTGDTEGTFTTSRSGSTFTIHRNGTPKKWQVLLTGAARVPSAQNVEMVNTPEGTLVKLEKSVQRVTLKTS